MNDELQFKLREHPMTAEERRGLAASVLFTIRPNPAIAAAVAALNEQAARSTAAMVCSIQQMLAAVETMPEITLPQMSPGTYEAVALALKPDALMVARVGAELRAATLVFARDMSWQAEQVAEAVAYMPEEEREEWRRIAEDASLCEVDVNAPELPM
jgi:hypothetical protein